MGFIDRIRKAFTDIFLEMPARAFGMDRLIRGLEKTGQGIEKRAARSNDRPSNRQVLEHIISLERWGQQRLRVALGEPLVIDECDDYQPAADTWPALHENFRATRQATISLIKSLRMARVDPGMRITHNQFGEISLLGWIYYLNLHATLESKRIN